MVVLDRFRRQKGVELVPVLRLLRPLAHSLKHVAMNLNPFVAGGWVVEGAEDVVQNFVDGDAGVFKGVEDPANGTKVNVREKRERTGGGGLRNDILNYCDGNTPSARVENVGKVVF